MFAVIILVLLFIASFFINTPGVSLTKSPVVDSNDQIVANNLSIPWGLVFLPDKSVLFTERAGRVRQITPTGAVIENPLTTISDVKAVGEGGLLGITLHPKYSINHYAYLYYTYSTDGQNTLNKVVRYLYVNNSFQIDKVIVEKIPGNIFHNGGRLKFGPDGYLYITTGDSLNPSLAQNTSSLAGKILRVTDDGKPVAGNPFKSLVYSYGHRNPQGLAWDENGRLWETEHGNNAHDEINIINIGNNYGWPTIIGDQKAYGMITPVLTSGNETWAPSGAVYIKPFLYFAGLRSSSLFRYDTKTGKLDQFLKGKYGRLRDVVLGPDNFLYITTSNMDGRALTNLDGDKIIKVDPSTLK